MSFDPWYDATVKLLLPCEDMPVAGTGLDKAPSPATLAVGGGVSRSATAPDQGSYSYRMTGATGVITQALTASDPETLASGDFTIEANVKCSSFTVQAPSTIFGSNFNGANGATTFTDVMGATISNTDNMARLSTSTKMFGTAALEKYLTPVNATVTPLTHSSATAQNVAVPVPSGGIPGDLLVCVVTAASNTTTNTTTGYPWTAPASWLRRASGGQGNGFSFAVYAYDIMGPAPTTAVFNHLDGTQFCATMMLFKNATATSGLLVNSLFAASANPNPPQAQSVYKAPDTGTGLVLAGFAAAGLINEGAWPSGFTSVAAVDSPSATEGSPGTGTCIRITGLATVDGVPVDPTAFTAATGAHMSFSLTIMPRITSGVLTVENTGGLFDVPAGDFTIEAFFNSSATEANGKRLLATIGNKFFGSGLPYSGFILSLDYAAGGAPRGVYFSGVKNSSEVVGLYPATTLANNTWHHVAVVKTGTTWKMYLNGVLEATEIQSDAIPAGAHPLYIGCDPSYPTVNGDFVGFIDDVRISNTAVYTSSFSVPTVEFTTTPSTTEMNIVGNDSIATKAWRLVAEGETPTYRFKYSQDGVSWNTLDTGTPVVLGTWDKLAVSRAGDTLRIYQNAIFKASAVLSGAIAAPATSTLKVGGASADLANGNAFDGYLDGLRISTNLARYTTSADQAETGFPLWAVGPNSFLPMVSPVPTLQSTLAQTLQLNATLPAVELQLASPDISGELRAVAPLASMSSVLKDQLYLEGVFSLPLFSSESPNVSGTVEGVLPATSISTTSPNVSGELAGTLPLHAWSGIYTTMIPAPYGTMQMTGPSAVMTGLGSRFITELNLTPPLAAMTSEALNGATSTILGELPTMTVAFVGGVWQLRAVLPDARASITARVGTVARLQAVADVAQLSITALATAVGRVDARAPSAHITSLARNGCVGRLAALSHRPIYRSGAHTGSVGEARLPASLPVLRVNALTWVSGGLHARARKAEMRSTCLT